VEEGGNFEDVMNGGYLVCVDGLPKGTNFGMVDG